MKGHEIKAIDHALTGWKVRLHAPRLTESMYRREAGKAVEDRERGQSAPRDLEDLVNRLTTVEALEVAYRLLGRLLEGVSGWRKLLRWAIGKVMELLAGMIART